MTLFDINCKLLIEGGFIYGKQESSNQNRKGKIFWNSWCCSVTRDRVYGTVNYNDYSFHLIDTGGIELGNNDFNNEIRMQASLAIDEADLVLFVVDGKDGLTSDDFLVRDMLKKISNKVIVVINKCDSKNIKETEYDFYELGFNTYIKVSGEQGDGFYDLYDAITENFPKYELQEQLYL